MAQILDGRIVRDKIAEDLKKEISRLRVKSRDSKCKLVIIQVGDLPESNTYIRQKVLFGEKIGAIVEHIKLPENISQEDLISQISTLNSQLSTHGIIVQMPIPKHLDKDKIVDTINPVKDVDGQTSTNIKLLFVGSSHYSSSRRREVTDKNIIDSKVSSRYARTITNDGYVPATTKGILTLLDHYKIPVAGKNVVIIGRSSLVGKPTALALLNRDATVTICHSKTRNLAQVTRNADVLIVAVGKPKLITKEYVSKEQVVVDVGINVIADRLTTNDKRLKPSFAKVFDPEASDRRAMEGKPETEPSDRKLVGDVDFENVSQIVKAISPVPGGCGPMTVASLFQNLLEAYNRQVNVR